MNRPGRTASLVGSVLAIATLSLSGAAGAGAHAAAPSGPPVVSVNLVGGTGLTGPVTPSMVHCALPLLTGTEILVIGTPTDPNLSVRLELTSHRVLVGVDTGSGAQYEERDFVGHLAHFNVTRGGTVTSTLTPVPPPSGTAVPNLPSVASLRGTVSCAGQTAGSSTLKFIGTTESGKIASRISPVSVTCEPGSQVLIIGIVRIGHDKSLIDMNVSAGAFSFALVHSSKDHEYKASPGEGSVTAGGASVNGNATEVAAPGVTTLHTLHVAGHVTCGKGAGA